MTEVSVRLSDMSVWQKIQLLRHQMKECCLEREYHIDALIALMISKQHGLLLGPPGTGKSMLIELLCKAFSGNYFTMLISESVKPEQFFGPISIKALKGDKEDYARNICKMLPEADIAYLDEIFKTNAGSLNELLKIINERKYKHGREMIDVPLRSVIGSSNELPEEGTGAAAFVDRFAWKNWVGYLQEKDNIITLWQRTARRQYPAVTVRLNLSDLDIAEQSAFDNVDLESSFSLLYTLKHKLKDAGYEITDRKWQLMIDFMRVFAWVRNEDKLTIDIIKLLLPDCMWQQPQEQRQIVDKLDAILKDISSRIPEIEESLILRITDTGSDFHSESKFNADDWNNTAFNALTLCDEWLKEIEDLRASGVPAEDCNRAAKSINAAIAHVKQEIDEVNGNKEEKVKTIIQDAINKGRNLVQAVITTATDTDAWNDSAATASTIIANSIKRLKDFDNGNGTSAMISDAKKDLKQMIREIDTAIIQTNNLN